jgi:hypothetical protein
MAFWKDRDVQEFEQACHQIGNEVEIEAKNCDRTLSSQDQEDVKKLKEDLWRVLEELKIFHRIQASLNRLEIKIDLDELPLPLESTSYVKFMTGLNNFTARASFGSTAWQALVSRPSLGPLQSG